LFLSLSPPSSSQSQTQIGRPTVENVIVKAKVEEHLDGAKVIVFKKKRRTVRFSLSLSRLLLFSHHSQTYKIFLLFRQGYKRTTGFRAQHSVVRITAIDDL
jgi:ribosomal protein L21